MPVYDYFCKECGVVQEVEHSFNDEPEITCPKCGKPMKRKIGNVGIIFKGLGWYSKDSSLEKDKIPKEVWDNAEKKGLV